MFRNYLKFHDIPTGWCSNETCSNCQLLSIQLAHIARILIMINYLKIKQDWLRPVTRTVQGDLVWGKCVGHSSGKTSGGAELRAVLWIACWNQESFLFLWINLINLLGGSERFNKPIETPVSQSSLKAEKKRCVFRYILGTTYSQSLKTGHSKHRNHLISGQICVLFLNDPIFGPFFSS